MFGLFKRKKKESDMVWRNYRGDIIEDPMKAAAVREKTAKTVLECIEECYIVHLTEDTNEFTDGRLANYVGDMKTNWTEKTARIMINDGPESDEVSEILENHLGFRSDKPAMIASERADREEYGVQSKWYQFEGNPGDYLCGEKFGKLMHALEQAGFAIVYSVGDKTSTNAPKDNPRWIYEHIDVQSRNVFTKN